MHTKYHLQVREDTDAEVARIEELSSAREARQAHAADTRVAALEGQVAELTAQLAAVANFRAHQVCGSVAMCRRGRCSQWRSTLPSCAWLNPAPMFEDCNTLWAEQSIIVLSQVTINDGL
jgi:hypothetical protein